MTRPLPAWAKDRGRSFSARLLEILRTGGPRKVSVLRAWAKWAGMPSFDSSIDLMKSRGLVEEVRKPGPTNTDSGPYLQLMGSA